MAVTVPPNARSLSIWGESEDANLQDYILVEFTPRLFRELAVINSIPMAGTSCAVFFPKAFTQQTADNTRAISKVLINVGQSINLPGHMTTEAEARHFVQPESASEAIGWVGFEWSPGYQWNPPMIAATLKRLHSPDVSDLASFVPEHSTKFGFLLQIIAGPLGERGEESFDVVVCTPSLLSERLGPKGFLIGRHHLLMNQYDYPALAQFISDYCKNCRGQSWREVAEQLGRIGKWEFENYNRD